MVRGAGAHDAIGCAVRTVTGQSEAVARWMLAQIPHCRELPGGYEAIGVVSITGDLIGGCLYTDYKPGDRPGLGNLEMWAAGKGRWLDRGVIRDMFAYPFEQCGCHRVTCITTRKNKPARKLLEKLGFKNEGVIRQGLAPHGDAFVYGMLKRECRWING